MDTTNPNKPNVSIIIGYQKKQLDKLTIKLNRVVQEIKDKQEHIKRLESQSAQ